MIDIDLSLVYTSMNILNSSQSIVNIKATYIQMGKSFARSI